MFPHEVIKNTRRLEIYTKRLVDSLFAGEYFSVFKGRGIEFQEIREYQPGDDIRDIDWKVTARMGSPFIRRYIEERELSVILLVDGSASMRFGTGGRTKRDVVLELCAFLGMSAIKRNNRLGIIVFTDRIELFCSPRKGKNNFYNVIGKLFTFSSENPPLSPFTKGGDILTPPLKKGGWGGFGTDIKYGLEYLNRVIKKSSLVFLISDFILPENTPSPQSSPLRGEEGMKNNSFSPAGRGGDKKQFPLPYGERVRVRGAEFTSMLKVASRRHDIIPIVVSDPREYTLPRGHFIELTDHETGETILIDSFRKEILHKFYLLSYNRKKEIEDIFRSIGLDYVNLSTSASYLRPMKELFYKRGGRRR